MVNLSKLQNLKFNYSYGELIYTCKGDSKVYILLHQKKAKTKSYEIVVLKFI